MRKTIQIASLLTISSLVVNGGNYASNYLMSQFLSVAEFSEANLTVTLFIGISFLATAFQLTAAKSVETQDNAEASTNLYTWAAIVGVLVGAFFVLAAPFLATFFHTDSPFSFYILGIISPFYFIMSAGRGLLQGRTEWKKWMLSFHLEMWSRLILTISLLYLGFGANGAAIAVALSVVFAAFVIPSLSFRLGSHFPNHLRTFFIGIIIYELAQILINNGDVILVKYYFDADNAGKYAALSLIGKITYFATWAIAQYMIGELIQMRKAGKDTKSFFATMMGMLGGIIFFLVLGISLFSNTLLFWGFGKEYAAISNLLGKYALLSGLFAICNIIVYYNLFFHQKTPLYMTLVLAFGQLVVMTFLHSTLLVIVQIQIIGVAFLTLLLIIRQILISKNVQKLPFIEQ